MWGTRMSVPRRLTAELLHDVDGCHRAIVTAAEYGVVAGLALTRAAVAPDPAGCWRPLCSDGDRAAPGMPLIEVTGSAWEIAVAGDHVLGTMGFAGGIARRASELVAAAPTGLRLACGAWKKLPVAMKPALRAGLDVAGVSHRLVDGDFVYVDKNAVRLLGGVTVAVERALALRNGPVAVQVDGPAQGREAAAAGCGIVMVDTGDLDDLAATAAAISGAVGVRLAFGGGVGADTLVKARDAGADIVDIGRAILDAPLWDLRLEVVG
jgi:nicotinate-nucleotide pyrophosphorylase (carboxylating)